MDDNEIIIELSRKAKLNQQDRQAIKALIAEAGVDFKFNTRCPNCYRDALAVLRNHYGIRMSATNEENNRRILINRRNG